MHTAWNNVIQINGVTNLLNDESGIIPCITQGIYMLQLLTT